MKYSKIQLITIVTLRVLIGWYMLFEGTSKLMTPGWSAYSYLKNSQGWFPDFFKALAENEPFMTTANFLNIWGLIAIGLALVLGLFTRYAACFGMALLALYYMAQTPLIECAIDFNPLENTMWVDKNLVFIAVFLVLIVFPSRQIGLDRFLINKKK